MNTNKFLLAIIIPVYKGENSIERLVSEIHQNITTIPFEIILINDCSPDTSDAKCRKLVNEFQNIKYCSLMRNAGEFNAVMCGLNQIESEYAIMIDDDFQNPPSEILKLLNHAITNDFDVVYSYYEKKNHHWFRNIGSQFVNFLTTYLFNKPSNLYLSSFKIINHKVVEEIIKYKGPYPYLDALIFRVTNNVGSLMVQHNRRSEGESSYTFKKLHSLFMTIFFGYSILPSRLIFYSGFSFIFLSIVITTFIFFGSEISYIVPLIVFFSGVQLLSVGIIGEYISKLYLANSQHPQYTIRDFIKSND